MNFIDKNFYELVHTIQKQSLEEVYHSILEHFSKIPVSLQESLEDYFGKFPYWGTLNHQENQYEELYLRACSLKEHIDDYIWLYEKLGDYRSKKVLFAVMNNWYRSDMVTLLSSAEKNYSHYFDLDIVKCNENEVLVDLGAYTGDTILDYLACYGVNCYKKIYCYEITEHSFEVLKNNLSYYPNIVFSKKAVSDCTEKLYIQKSSVDDSANVVSSVGDIVIDATSIDLDIPESVTLIKMDIEGYEQRALLGCKEHILNDHPKLLISVYHNHEDIWKIPTMIEEICPGYQFYLRYYGNNVFPTETVLVGIYSDES